MGVIYRNTPNIGQPIRMSDIRHALFRTDNNFNLNDAQVRYLAGKRPWGTVSIGDCRQCTYMRITGNVHAVNVNSIARGISNRNVLLDIYPGSTIFAATSPYALDLGASCTRITINNRGRVVGYGGSGGLGAGRNVDARPGTAGGHGMNTRGMNITWINNGSVEGGGGGGGGGGSNRRKSRWKYYYAGGGGGGGGQGWNGGSGGGVDGVSRGQAGQPGQNGSLASRGSGGQQGSAKGTDGGRGGVGGHFSSKGVTGGWGNFKRNADGGLGGKPFV